MIEKTTAFRVGEQFFPCIEEAQKQELKVLILAGLDDHENTAVAIQCATAILANKEQVLNILTMTPTSHPKARRANGATRKPRKPKTEPTPAV